MTPPNLQQLCLLYKRESGKTASICAVSRCSTVALAQSGLQKTVGEADGKGNNRILNYLNQRNQLINQYRGTVNVTVQFSDR